MRSLRLVPLMVIFAVLIPLDLAARTDALEDPATTTVLEMISAGQAEEEILETEEAAEPEVIGKGKGDEESESE